MFKLNELIMIRNSLELDIELLEIDIETTKNQGLKIFRIDELERLVTLRKKVQSQLNLSARFDDDNAYSRLRETD